MLKIDYTLFIQIANFLFLLLVLNWILYRPIRSMLRRRRAEMTSLQEKINDLEDEAAERSYELEESMVGARREGSVQKESLRHAGLEEEKVMVHGATGKAGDRIDQARAEIDQNLNAARQALENEVSAFSRELAEKILGRSV
jgi:F-type H+-transporting ATPase subunit b